MGIPTKYPGKMKAVLILSIGAALAASFTIKPRQGSGSGSDDYYSQYFDYSQYDRASVGSDYYYYGSGFDYSGSGFDYSGYDDFLTQARSGSEDFSGSDDFSGYDYSGDFSGSDRSGSGDFSGSDFSGFDYSGVFSGSGEFSGSGDFSSTEKSD